MYNDDISLNGCVIPYDTGDYLGYELEYTPQFFRLGEKKYYDPEYKLSVITAQDYNEGGGFRQTYPDLFEFIEKVRIEIDGVDDYERMEDTLLERFDIIFDEDPFNEKYFFPSGCSAYS